MKIYYVKLFIYLNYLTFSYSQLYIPADPYYTLSYELNQFKGNIKPHSLSMRPFYFLDKKTDFLSLKYSNNIFYNNNAPNQENMDVRYIGNGTGIFTSFHISGYSKYLAFNIEPYIINSNYSTFKRYNREPPFNYLNDAKTSNDFKSTGFRKADIYIHYNGIGFGLSNSNMWWGPGIQGSLAMTNNTTGFKHFMIGTIKEQRWKDIGFLGKYVFAELNDLDDWEAIYFTALVGQVTFYKKQIFTFGLSRNFLTGGMQTKSLWSKKDAQMIIFEGFLIENLQKLDYTIAGHDAWDQTITGWFEMALPKSKMKIYLEIGYNDNRFNFWDFVVHPDHSMATTIGFRKYGLLNNDNIIYGFEYANLIKSRHHIFRLTPNWYERDHYKDFTYDNRRWGAHSGSDSDDLLFYMGFMNEKWAIIPSFNFERHGVTTHRPPEIKIEFGIDTRFNYNKYEFGLYYERQYEAHIGFPNDAYFTDEITEERRTRTFIFRIEKNIY